MPHIYTVDHERRRVFVEVTEPVSHAEVLALLDRQTSDGAWAYGRLEDLSAVRTWLPTSEELRQFLKQVREISCRHGPRGPIAFVITECTALFGMFRMYSILGDDMGATIGAFHSREEATRWLDGHADDR